MAFSLVELSIVLVILGLLVGGVLTGKSLIRASELRTVPVQNQQIITAVRNFRDKYFGLPGDITNATKLWGAQAAPAACASSPSTATATCDGDGDGQIKYFNTGSTSQENFRFWQQLSNAGLITGTYSGTDLSGGGIATTANSFAGKISSTLWAVDYRGTVTTSNDVCFSGEYGHALYFGTHW